MRDRLYTWWMAVLLLACCGAMAQEPVVQPPVSFSGDRVTLNVVDQEITGVLRLLSEAQRVNIIAGPEVTGNVTVNLYDVGFEEALAAILNISGYSWYRVGNIVYVTTEERRGELSPAVNNMQVKTFALNHADSEALVELVTPLLSAGGQALIGLNRSLVVVDVPERIATIEQLVGQMDQPQRQVLIKVHIITVERDDNLTIGTGFDTVPLDMYNIEAIANGFAEGFPPRPDPETGEVNPLDVPTGTGLFTGTLQSDFRAFIEALDRATDVEILASPQLLALDGEVARLQVGDRLGFRITTTTETASLESVEFLEVGTVLEVTPTISNDGVVKLEITPKVSSGFIDDEGLPTESTTEVGTQMLVQDGQTIIIGGLLNASRQRIRSQIPFLGDLPLLGKLFGRTNWIDDQSEVVVFLTPEIVGPQGTLEMREKFEDAKARWQPFEERGMVAPEVPVLKPNPEKRWRDFLRQRGALPVNGAPSVETEATVVVEAPTAVDLP